MHYSAKILCLIKKVLIKAGGACCVETQYDAQSGAHSLVVVAHGVAHKVTVAPADIECLANVSVLSVDDWLKIKAMDDDYLRPGLERLN